MKIIDLRDNTSKKWDPTITIQVTASAYISYDTYQRSSEFRLVETKDILSVLGIINDVNIHDEKWIRLTFSSKQLNSGNLALGGYLTAPPEGDSGRPITYRFVEMFSWVAESVIRDVMEGGSFKWNTPINLHDGESHHSAILELYATAKQPAQYFCEEPDFTKAMEALKGLH